MEITITWTKIIVLTVGYFTGRYVYFTYLKWVTGCQNPFDPTEHYRTAAYTRGWNMGYIHGSQKLKVKYGKCRRQYIELKEKYRIAHAKLTALENDLPD
jgi:hypothetical protein